MKNLIETAAILSFIETYNPSALKIQVDENLPQSAKNLFIRSAYEMAIQALYTPKVTTVEDVWNFVEENYEAYYHADEILENDYLTKIAEGDANEKDISKFIENYGVDISLASDYKISSDIQIYEKAILGYLNKKS